MNENNFQEIIKEIDSCLEIVQNEDMNNLWRLENVLRCIKRRVLEIESHTIQAISILREPTK